jgi:hypothetical protein
MSLTMYTATVPTCVRALNSLASILEKAAAHAQLRKIDAAVLLGTRLFPDMMPLAMQIHVANDIAQGGAARLAGAPVPAFEAKERNFGEWIAATQSTIAYLESLKPAQFEGSEDKTVTWQTRTSTKNMQGTPYLFHHVLPNVFFHVTTAYDILRQSGLDIGKMDYLGKAIISEPSPQRSQLGPTPPRSDGDGS